ncbi:MAG: GNA1162 family protein [Candidatus Hydrogenedentota bacterium]
MRLSLLLILLIIFSLLFIGCATSVNEAMQPYEFDNFGADHSMITKPKIKIAVIPFRNASGIGGAGIRVSESFVVQLLKIGRYEVIERTRIDQILNEQKFSQLNIVDQETAIKIGKIAGVDAVLIGTVTEYRDMWEGETPPEVGANVRLIDIETGAILWAASEHFRGDDASVQLLVKRQERWKVVTDIDFLTTLLCKSMASSMAL